MAKLFYPVANPVFNFQFCKGYYPRVADSKMNGRVSRLLVFPLLLAMETLDFPPGSEIITPVLTFSTTVGYIVRNNWVPVFVDVEEGTYCINEDKIKNLITKTTYQS